ADRVERAMSLTPGDRPQSAQALHDELSMPGVVHRYWSRVPTHPGHDRCWTEDRSMPGALHQLCVISTTSGQYEIETRRIGGTRLLDYCATVSAAALAPRLRRFFNRI